MDSSNAVTHISLCSGYGGIDLGLKRVLPNLRTVAYCEREAFASANLVSKMEAGLLDAAPIWTDVKTFPWDSFRDRVDILSGGYPCQPFSAAGKRLGTDDPRHLWPFIADGISRMRPRACFFENVEGHITLGLATVISDLEELGYRATWGIFSAAEVGAPHQRKRVFILADTRSSGPQGQWGQCGFREGRGEVQTGWSGGNVWPSRPGEQQYCWEPPRVVGDSPPRTVANTRDDAGERRDTMGSVPCCSDGEPSEGEGSGGGGSDQAGVGPQCESLRGGAESSVELANGDGRGRELIGQSESTGEQRALGDQLDGRDCAESAVGNTEGERSATCRTKHAELSGEPGAAVSSDAVGDTGILDEQRRGARSGRGQRSTLDAATGDAVILQQAEPSLGRDTDGTAGRLDYAELCRTSDNRTDELRLLGNGVVPATAERAFTVLSQRLLKV